jgi:hypothetical protein
LTDAYDSLHGPETPRRRPSTDPRKPRDWSLAPRNDDLLTGLNSGEKLGKIGLRNMYGDNGHDALHYLSVD